MEDSGAEDIPNTVWSDEESNFGSEIVDVPQNLA